MISASLREGREALAQLDDNIVRLHHALKLVEFTPKEKTDVDQVLDDVRALAPTLTDIVIAVRGKDGDFSFYSNQGSTPGLFYFLEQGKAKILQLESEGWGTTAS
jgi:hypothetical protein